MLTASDFEITEAKCPYCRRPARIYSRKGNNYLRCTWNDCWTNANMLVPSIESFYRIIEKFESGRGLE